MADCIFCKIASGEAPAEVVWENDDHLAFLSIFPNTEGVTVVIPKTHYPSYIFEVPDEVMTGLMKAGKNVALLLDKAFDDVGRTAVAFEGFGVNHLHAKLFPLHGTKADDWKQVKSDVQTYFDTYRGYISTHDYQGISTEELSKTADIIRNSKR